MNIKLTKSLFPVLLILLFSGCSDQSESETPLKIWFDQPTTKWNEGFPLGNGSLGGMIYGLPGKEQITLNEETIWTGEKLYDRDMKDGHKYLGQIQQLLFDGEYVEAEKLADEKLLAERLPSGTMTYQMLANLWIESPGLDSVENYRRVLDLNNSLATTRFNKDGVKYSREYFSSFPDKTMVIRYAADKKGALKLSAWIERTENTSIQLSNDRIIFSEHVGDGIGVKFHSIVDFETIGGESHVENGKIVIEGASELIIRIVASSDYRGGDPENRCMENMSNALLSNYKELLKSHTEDYRSLFKRVDLKISEGDGEDMPTDERLQRVKEGTADNYLTQLQYQFGRYLLISSSRPGTLPANLQGIWADGFSPPWNSDYHININIQMNYWLAEMTNLAECHEPFLKFIGDLREMGRISAMESYGCGGFVAHHTSDAWHATAAFGRAGFGMWPMGAAWCCQHLYTHYEYTEDREYLGEYAYPVMKEAAQFFVDFMVPDPTTGLLVSGPSISPENRFLDKNGERATMNMGPTMDREIIFELFQNCIQASDILDIDKKFRDTLKHKIQQMPPLQIGSDGRLMEWVEEFEEADPGHRHISHLYALHPSNQISKSATPELFEAAKKTLEYRLSHGGGHTGWSRAWIVNFYARLLEAEKAQKNIVALQQKSTLPNLLDIHPPFQIDGNFGVVSGITEMLMQSHTGEIHVLPALPEAWASGHIKGIVARKGFELDIRWENGKLENLVVRSKLGNPLQLRYGDKVIITETTVGQVLQFNGEDFASNSVSFSYAEISGIGKDSLFNRRDNSDIIKVGNKHYVWYTRMDSPITPGYWGNIWYASSEDEGYTWKEQGMALGTGEDGAFDSFGVFTPNILAYEGKYYLYYTGVKPTPGNPNKEFEGNSTTDITAIGLAVADS
ncbi:MAG: glycoside hydrolase N-terminal domain-containing protein, partial [Bacteroides sp.]|nr:glycoside hydrolase N-terminal domain-containing protein [Bacteroides sp.]